MAPERYRPLRLAPLPTDRTTGAQPLRFVQLGRAERHNGEQSLLRLTVQVPGQMLRKEVRFGADSGFATEPLNRGPGRFLLAQGFDVIRGLATVEGAL